ncbi:sulfotransferase [Cryomorphaceae bacterium]|nr:sulfotransferase [Cryomorphaceae bacterium]
MGLSDRGIQFIGLGEMKSGTSWVANALAQHPDVGLSFPKELHYFNDRFAYYNPQKSKYAPDLRGYWSHFKHASNQKVLGEFSVHYLFDPVAAERIHRHFPDVKLIVCHRDPVERAYSQWTWSHFHKKQESRSFEEVMATEGELIERGLYFQNIQPYLELFSEDQFLYLSLKDIRQNPEDTLSRIADFLELSPFPSDIDLSSRNRAKSTKSSALYGLQRFIGENLHRFGLSGLGDSVRRSGLGKALSKVNSKAEDLPPFKAEYHDQYDQLFSEDQERWTQFVSRAPSK